MKKTEKNVNLSESITIKLLPEEKSYLKERAEKESLSLSKLTRKIICQEMNMSKTQQVYQVKKELSTYIRNCVSVLENYKSLNNFIKQILDDPETKLSDKMKVRLIAGANEEIVSLNDNIVELKKILLTLGGSNTKCDILNTIKMEKMTIAGLISSEVRVFKTKNGTPMCSFSVTAKGSNNIKGISEKETLFVVYSRRPEMANTFVEGLTVVVYGDFDFKESEIKNGEKKASLIIYAEEIQVFE